MWASNFEKSCELIGRLSEAAGRRLRNPIGSNSMSACVALRSSARLIGSDGPDAEEVGGTDPPRLGFGCAITLGSQGLRLAFWGAL